MVNGGVEHTPSDVLTKPVPQDTLVRHLVTLDAELFRRTLSPTGRRPMVCVCMGMSIHMPLFIVQRRHHHFV